MKKLIVVLVILIAAISCSKKTTGNKTVATVTETPPIVIKKVEESSIVKANTETAPSNEDADAAAKEKMNVTLRAAGKEAYSVKCTRCHEAFEPSKYVAAKWEKLVDWMGPRAKLEIHEKEAILAYVKYNAKK